MQIATDVATHKAWRRRVQRTKFQGQEILESKSKGLFRYLLDEESETAPATPPVDGPAIVGVELPATAIATQAE